MARYMIDEIREIISSIEQGGCCKIEILQQPPFFHLILE